MYFLPEKTNNQNYFKTSSMKPVLVVNTDWCHS